jgi:hypothetical protein
MALKPCKECGKEISTEAKNCPHCGKKDPTGRQAGCLGIGCLSIVVLAVIGNLAGPNPSPSSSALSAPPPSNAKEQVRAQLDLNFSWRKEGFDNVMTADFTITNRSTRPVKDVEITCIHHAPSGTEIDRNTRTIYEIIPAKGKKRIHNFNMGLIHSQVRSSACNIADFEFAD